MSGQHLTTTKTRAVTLATSLREISAQATLEPLESGDPRYADLAAGRATHALQMMKLGIEDHDADQNRYAKIAFTGHRGCGKSTELLRMEFALQDDFTCLHLYLDETLILDCQYSDLLLWLVESIIEKFKDLGLQPPQYLVEEVADWFAEKTLEDMQTVKSEISAEISAEAKGGIAILDYGLKMLARIRARVQGNVEQRHLIRSKLQNYGADLVERVNTLLDWFQDALVDAGRRPDILIVQDNLDRLPFDVARRLFFDHGQLLKGLRAHVIFTHPIAMVMAPHDINKVFETCYTMRMVKVAQRSGEPYGDGVEALVALIGKRVAIDRVFADRAVAQSLARRSGGSVRDLLRLLNYAQLQARVDGKTTIDQPSADAAVKQMRLDFEKLLVPGNVYYPLLAGIHRSKTLGVSDVTPATAADAQAARDFFSQLLFNGSVLEYNGDQTWYDVHPVIRDIEAFKSAFGG